MSELSVLHVQNVTSALTCSGMVFVCTSKHDRNTYSG